MSQLWGLVASQIDDGKNELPLCALWMDFQEFFLLPSIAEQVMPKTAKEVFKVF